MEWIKSIDAESIVSYLEFIGKDFNFIINKLMISLNISFDDAYEEFLKYSKSKSLKK